MSVTVTFSHEDPRALLADMAAMAGVTASAPAVYDVSSDNGPLVPAGTPLPSTLIGNATTTTEQPKPRRGRPAKAEVKLPEQPAEEAKIFTIDDVRNAATPYIKKHTMAMAQLDLPDCLEAAVGIRQISKLNTADQAQLKKAVEAFEAAGKVDTRFAMAAA